MKEAVGIRARPRVGIRNSEQRAVQGQRLTVQWDGGLDSGAVIMTLRNTPELAKKVKEFPAASLTAWQTLVQCRRSSAGDQVNRTMGIRTEAGRGLQVTSS